MEHDNIEYPVRINRYLQIKGYASRRRADTLIEEGAVTINGKRAQLGAQVQEGDVVRVSEKSSLPKTYRYIAYHKPVGITSDLQRGAQTIWDAGGFPKELFPVGRLDKASRGLMLLTNDSRITEKLLDPKHEHEKEYAVTLDKRVTDSALNRMAKGVNIEGYRTKPASVRRAGQRSFRITLTEGKRHQIRRMAAALGYQVRDLRRMRIMHIALGNLKEGAARELSEKEIRTLLESLNVPASPREQ